VVDQCFRLIHPEPWKHQQVHRADQRHNRPQPMVRKSLYPSPVQVGRCAEFVLEIELVRALEMRTDAFVLKKARPLRRRAAHYVACKICTKTLGGLTATAATLTTKEAKCVMLNTRSGARASEGSSFAPAHC